MVLGGVVLGALVWQIVRAWRYRRDHPEEIFWPYNKPKEKAGNEK